MPSEPLFAPRLSPAAVTQAIRRRYHRLRAWLSSRQRYQELALEKVAGFSVVVLPEVMNPRIFWSGEFLARSLGPELVRRGSRVLDMGTGSGIGGLAAARLGAEVLSVDINPRAVRCARINALLNFLDDRMLVREGNLFCGLEHERFDVITFNPPYYAGEPRDHLFDAAFRGGDVIERFAAELRHHLRPDGFGLLVFSSCVPVRPLRQIFVDAGYRLETVAEWDPGAEQLFLDKVVPLPAER